jgi:GNAT superfamily N-acetyltransferase
MEYRLLSTEAERQMFIIAWEKAFSRKLDNAVYDWIFNPNNSLYAIIADDGRIAAGYCLLSTKAAFQKQIVKAALCNNVFVLPDFRGENLFIKIGQYALSHAQTRGIKIALGIPNANALPGHVRVGWTVLEPIQFLEFVGQYPVCEKKKKNNVIELGVDNADSFLDKIGRFSENISKTRTFSIVKTSEYFQWRYLERPNTNYKIFMALAQEEAIGYIVYKYYAPDNRLHIIDIEAKDNSVVVDLLQYSNCFPSYSLLNVWGSSQYFEALLAEGFQISSENSNLIAIYPYRKDTVLLGDTVNIVLGDNDVF